MSKKELPKVSQATLGAERRRRDFVNGAAELLLLAELVTYFLNFLLDLAGFLC